MKKHPKMVSFDAEFEREMKDPKFRTMYEEERYRLEVALAIVALRKKGKLSQIALAKRIGSSQSAVARMEAGNANVTVDTLGRIAIALGVKMKVTFA
jgi:ribosome-binding protein aMBF1 (putative translation factor)